MLSIDTNHWVFGGKNGFFGSEKIDIFLSYSAGTVDCDIKGVDASPN